jgi:hypothetical protein
MFLLGILFFRFTPHEILRKFHMRSALLWDIAVSNGNDLPTFRDNVSVPSSHLKVGPIGCPETSVKAYHWMLRNIAEERRSHPLRGENLESRKFRMFPLQSW